MKQDTIPLVKAAFKNQFVEALLNNGLSPDYYLEKVGLPTHDQDDPESLLPEKPFWHLINLVAVDAGIVNFGSQVAQITPWHEVESLGPLITNSSNLEGLLTTFCDIASSQSSHVSFVLEKEAGLWFSYNGVALIKNDIQMELYRITSMVQLVQLAAGSGWYPEQIQLQMSSIRNVQACDLISKSLVTFAQGRSGISIPRILLKLPVNLKVPDTLGSNKYDINADFVDTLRNIIGIYISNKKCTIDLIAKATEIPVRTLQRRLKQYGVNFNDLLNQAKFDLAKDKLENTSIPMIDIAFQLGYTSPAHFTRAFNRWVGMPPSKFRNTCSEEGQISQ